MAPHPCANSSRTPSGAAVHRDTIFPARNAASAWGAKRPRSLPKSSIARWRFTGPERGGGPFGAIRVVERNEVGSPPMVSRTSPELRSASTWWPSVSISLPLLFGIGLGDARRFVNSLHRHLVLELGVAADRADRRWAPRCRRPACRPAGCALRRRAGRTWDRIRPSRRPEDRLRPRHADR